MNIIRPVLAATAIAMSILASGVHAAELRIAEQFSIGSLQFTIIKRDKLFEKYAAQHGIDDLKVTWMRFNGPSAMNEAILSNSTDIVSTGVPGLLTIWDKTYGTPLEVRGIAAMSSIPFLLNTRNPKVKSITDFTEADRIAVPGVKVSVQAVVLQMAAAKQYGKANYDKLDPLTVSMTPTDSTIALLSGNSQVNTVFGTPPLQNKQLEDPAVHTVLSSFDIVGAHTYTAAWTTKRFHDGNPELYAAVLDALKEATQTIKDNPQGSAESWIAATNSNLSPDFVKTVMTTNGTEFTMAPQGIMNFAGFMHDVGTLSKLPASWEDVFFPEIGNVVGN